MADTGPTPDIRERVLARSGYRCENCGVGIKGPAGYSLQHRCARRMGGTKDARINAPSNLAVLCGSATTACHGLAERRDTLMGDRGYWLRFLPDAIWVPVRLFTREWVHLADSGLYMPCDPPDWDRILPPTRPTSTIGDRAGASITPRGTTVHA